MAQVFIGMGSSIDKQYNIQQGLLQLQQHFGELTVSSVFESEAVGFTGNNFYNLVVAVNTQACVEAVMSTLKDIEFALGRPKKTIKFAPRNLDLDILLYDQLVNKSLNIPRAEIIENAFVLQPLAELAPDRLHPYLGVNYQSLWQAYPKNKQKLWQITLPFVHK